MNHSQRKLKDMDWELKSLDNNFEVTDFDENLRPVLVGYQGNEEKILYALADGETIVRSDADQEKEDELTADDMKANKFDEIPAETVTAFLEKIFPANNSKENNSEENALNGEKNVNQNQQNSDEQSSNNTSNDNITRF